MNKTMKNEDLISEYIDTLNKNSLNKKKVEGAKIRQSRLRQSENADELKQLISTVKALNNLKSDVNAETGNTGKSRFELRPFVFHHYRKIVAAVCLIAILFASYMFGFPGSPVDIVYAMEKACDKLYSVSGVIEKIIIEDDENVSRETINISHKKPNLFTMKKTNGIYTTTIHYNGGDLLYEEFMDPHSKSVGHVSVDFINNHILTEQLKGLLLINIRDELQEVKVKNKEINKIAGEVVANRKTDGYEFILNSDGVTTIQRIWVDEETDLPLKWELVSPARVIKEGGVSIPERRYITYFTFIEIDPEIDNEIFEHEYDSGKIYYIRNKPATVELFRKHEAIFGDDVKNDMYNYFNSQNANTGNDKVTAGMITSILMDVDIMYNNFDLLKELNPDYYLVAKAYKYEQDNNIYPSVLPGKYVFSTIVSEESVYEIAKRLYGDQVKIKYEKIDQEQLINYGKFEVSYYEDDGVYTYPPTGGTHRFIPHVLEFSESDGNITAEVCFIKYSGGYSDYEGPYWDENLRQIGTIEKGGKPLTIEQVISIKDEMELPVREYVLKRREDGSLWVKSCRMISSKD